MESQPQNPEFRITPENFHTCIHAYSDIYRMIGQRFIVRTKLPRQKKTCANKIVPDQPAPKRAV